MEERAGQGSEQACHLFCFFWFSRLFLLPILVKKEEKKTVQCKEQQDRQNWEGAKKVFFFFFNFGDYFSHGEPKKDIYFLEGLRNGRMRHEVEITMHSDAWFAHTFFPEDFLIFFFIIPICVASSNPAA